jgi:hypothetical protein
VALFYNPWTGTISMWLGMRPLQQQLARLPQHALLAASVYYSPPGSPSFMPLSAPPPHQQQAVTSAWSPWTGELDQLSLAKFFNTMALTPQAATNWVANSGASNHITSDTGNLTFIRLPESPLMPPRGGE